MSPVQVCHAIFSGAAVQVSSMYMVVPVKQGGETLFASTSAGFNRLDPALQEQVGSVQYVFLR